MADRFKKVVKLIKLTVAGRPNHPKTGDIPVIDPGSYWPTQYNKAAEHRKTAEREMVNLKTVMQPAAIHYITNFNCDHPSDAMPSVVFKDKDGAATRITFTRKYFPVNATAAEMLFGHLRLKNGKSADINHYLHRTMVGTFDSSVFIGPHGFDAECYTKIMQAMEAVSKKLGIQNPLSTEEVVLPRPNFHEIRWQHFTPDANEEITEVIPNQVTFSPLPDRMPDCLVKFSSLYNEKMA
jgi:hypothetical protein